MKFDDTEIEKYKFHQYKSPILINNIDINKIVVSNKVKRNSIKKEFDSEPEYNDKYLGTKIKSCNGKINTNFHNNTERSLSMYLSINNID